MCTLLIFPCLPKMSMPAPLADLAEPPTTDKERQALETLQCQYLGNIGKLVCDRIPRHPHMLPCLPCRPALGNSFATGFHAIHTCFHAFHAVQHYHSLSPPLRVMALYLRSPGFSAKSMMLLLRYFCTRTPWFPSRQHLG